ncbi:hypothetical protein HGM15179_009174 [Zosterops borbonicus]|uniref:Uncharacterized protein n=1 Tax=Zosterops borbonicus TaxID=364589 RepID=A0A8K1GGC4_9PASS|nr:hypothetical protein HGM15179_009174 [Zosterops borbonicus]
MSFVQAYLSRSLWDGIPSFQHLNLTAQLGVICRVAEGALNPPGRVADRDDKKFCSQYLLRNVTWNVTNQKIPYSPSGPPMKSMSLQLRDKDVVQDGVKCFAQVQVDDVCFSSLIHECSVFKEGLSGIVCP